MHLAVIDDPDPIRQLFCLFQVMGRQDDRLAARPQLTHIGPEIAAELHIHPGRRLIQEHAIPVVGERLRDHETPPHAAREGARVRLPLVEEAERAQQLDDALLTQRDAEIAGLEAQGLFDREKGIEVDLLRDEADDAPGLPVIRRHIAATDQHFAGGPADQSGHDANEGRLAAPFGPRSAKISPFSISRETSSSAVNAP